MTRDLVRGRGRFVGVALACALLATTFVATASSSTTRKTAKQAKTFTLKFTSPDPETDPQAAMMDHFAQLVKKNSHGRINVVNYFNGVTGPTTSDIPAVAANTVQMTYANAALLGSYVPKFSFLQLPLMFVNTKIIYKGLNSHAIHVLDRLLLQKSHTRLLAWGALGFVDQFSSVRPLVSPSDIKGLKCRVIPGSQPLINAYTELGAEPVPIDATEFYTALQQGTVNCGQDPATVIYGVKLYEVAKYLTIMPFQYNPMGIIINNNFYTSLPKKLRRVVLEDIRKSAKWEIKLQAKEATADVAKMRQAGTQVVTLTASQTAAWEKATSQLRVQARKQYGEALLKAFHIK